MHLIIHAPLCAAGLLHCHQCICRVNRAPVPSNEVQREEHDVPPTTSGLVRVMTHAASTHNLRATRPATSLALCPPRFRAVGTASAWLQQHWQLLARRLMTSCLTCRCSHTCRSAPLLECHWHPSHPTPAAAQTVPSRTAPALWPAHTRRMSYTGMHYDDIRLAPSQPPAAHTSAARQLISSHPGSRLIMHVQLAYQRSG
jgi:hypothetical protein